MSQPQNERDPPHTLNPEGREAPAEKCSFAIQWGKGEANREHQQTCPKEFLLYTVLQGLRDIAEKWSCKLEKSLQL